MLYLILGILIVVLLITIIIQWLNRRRLDDQILQYEEDADLTARAHDEHEDGLKQIIELAFENIDELRQERDNALSNLAVVLTADPIPFNKVAVELGLHGVVYQFHSLEDPKEITS